MVLVARYNLGDKGIYIINSVMPGLLKQCMCWHSCAVYTQMIKVNGCTLHKLVTPSFAQEERFPFYEDKVCIFSDHSPHRMGYGIPR
jgi:hypothetical protein